MDVAKAQLKVLRTKLDTIPALEKAEVSFIGKVDVQV